MRLRHAGSDVVLIAAVAFAANFLYFHFSAGDFLFPDSISYLRPAQNLLHGFGFASQPDAPETFRTPGYPLFLLPFLALTTSIVPVIVAQHLLNIAIAVTVYATTRQLVGSRTAAMVAGLIAALDASTVHYANKVLSETLFTAVLLALFLFMLRMRRRGATAAGIVAAGAICGALVLIRPLAILYFIVLAALLATTEPVRRVAIFAVIAISIPIAWGVRNRLETDVFTVASVAGTNMIMHRAAPSIAIFGKGHFRDELAIVQARLIADANREIVDEEEVDSINDVDGPVVGQYYSEIGRRIALEHPLGLALVTVRGVFINLFESDWEAIEMVSSVPGAVLEQSIDAATAAATLLGIVGVFALWRRDRALAALIGATIAYFVIISAGSEAESRFRVPVVPQLAIAAGAGAEAIRRGVRDVQQTP